LKSLQHPYRSKIFSRIWATLLLVIFVNAILIESLHHHGVEKSTTENQCINGGRLVKQLTAAKVKCKLCEVLKHQSHFFNLPAPIALALPAAKPAVKIHSYLLKHPVAFILSCSNKGPPNLVA